MCVEPSLSDATTGTFTASPAERGARTVTLPVVRFTVARQPSGTWPTWNVVPRGTATAGVTLTDPPGATVAAG